MDIVVVGLNHKTSPVELRERLAISETRLPEVLLHLRDELGLPECLVLSTCNRTEIYATAINQPETVIKAEMANKVELKNSDFLKHLYEYHGSDAVRHLFEVASGIDSMIIGESQILGQVRRAYEIAQNIGCTGGIFSRLFEMALSVGKQVHTETRINQSDASVASVAVDLARKALGSLKDRRVLLLGAGEISALTAKRLMECGARGIIVANRTYDKAREVATLFRGRAVRYEDLERELADSDILIASSSAPRFMLRASQVEKIMLEREMRPLALIDIAVPRDIDPACAGIGGVNLYNIDDLNNVVEQSKLLRDNEIQKAEAIINQAENKFMQWQAALPAIPLIQTLSGFLEQIAASEIRRHKKQIETLDDHQLAAVHSLINSIINKTLSTPIKRLKDYASANDMNRLHIIADMFEISALNDSHESVRIRNIESRDN